MAFCVQADIESILSADGVTLHTDDTHPYDTTNSTHVSDAIERATTTIESYVWESYQTSDLEGTTWAKWTCATLAACDIVTRRGNSSPASVMARCEAVKEELESIRVGHRAIPNVAKVRKQIPSMSNLSYDGRFYVGRIRVVKPTSLGRQESSERRHIDYTTIGYVPVW